MFAANSDTPTPIGKLDDLMAGGDSSSRPQKVFIAHNLGSRTFLMHVPMFEFYQMSDVANERGDGSVPIAQRPLNEDHAKKLATYILKGLVTAAITRRKINNQPSSAALDEIESVMGKQPYMALQPLVVNIRTCAPGGTSLDGYRMMTKEQEIACFKVHLSQKDILWVVDGQHRRKGMEIAFAFLEAVRSQRRYPRKGTLALYDKKAGDEVNSADLEAWNECNEVARAFSTVAVEVHLGLGIPEERQLFHDLNNLAKKVERSLALKFDSANPINQFIQEVLLSDVLSWEEPLEKDVSDWKADTGIWTYKDLVAVNAHLFLNKTNISGAKPEDVESKIDVATQLWTAVKTIPNFGESGAKIKTVAAQPVVVKALAKLTFDFAFSKRKNILADTYLNKLLSEISSVDFSHTNPMWRFYELTEAERETHGLSGLKEFLPSDDQGFNRDIGNFDKNSGWMRFGAKHNDIYPIIADMIRWKLNLPKRGAKDDDEVLHSL